MNAMDPEAILDRLLVRQRAAPEYAARRASVEAMLESRHVSPTIRERIFRLNPRLVEGAQLRGWHYKEDPRWNLDVESKGAVMRKYGRQFWADLPRSAIVKRGRREFVSHLELMRRGSA